MVEFALVAPLLFAALFGALDGALLMFSAGAVNHATGTAMISVAQDGKSPTADTAAVQAMMAGGAAAIGFAKLDEVDIYLIQIDSTTGAVTQDTNSCGGVACLDRYSYTASTNIVNLLNPLGSGAAPWPPGSRDTASGTVTNIGITVKCHYNYLAFSSAQLSITQTRYFRLEPTS
jgi:Flp pilus assembly protein TadG